MDAADGTHQKLLCFAQMIYSTAVTALPRPKYQLTILEFHNQLKASKLTWIDVTLELGEAQLAGVETSTDTEELHSLFQCSTRYNYGLSCMYHLFWSLEQ